jgi:hypothetical protein
MNRKVIFGAAAVLIIAVMALLIIRIQRKQNSSDEAIRNALLTYLSQRSGLNMSAMDVNIKQVTQEGDHAEAQVEFRAKQGDAKMEMTYKFERQGDNWVVKGSSGTAGSGHPAIPESAPPQPGATGELPPGHPAVPPVHGTGNPPAQSPSSAPHP